MYGFWHPVFALAWHQRLMQACLLLLVICMSMPASLDAKAMRKKRKRQGQSQQLRKKRKRRQQAVSPVSRKKKRRRHAFAAVAKEAVQPFSKTICRFYSDQEIEQVQQSAEPQHLWIKENTDPFGELIVSWNALRPAQGHIAIWVSVLHHGQWSSWHKLAVWGHKLQKTFLHKAHPAVHTKHCRVEMQHGNLARGFKVKVTFHKGADPAILKAIFGCISRLNQQKIIIPDSSLETVVIKKGLTKISQMKLGHERNKSMCSPASMAMSVSYFHQTHHGRRPHFAMTDYALDFAENVLDQSDLNIYGNWILNTAHAFHAMDGGVYFSVQRLNSFYDLYHYLSHKVPVVVSVRKLPGGATPYAGGHLLMVIGYDSQARRVICLDPAFSPHHATLKSYPLVPFIHAWARSNNLSYVPLLKSMVGQEKRQQAAEYAPPISESPPLEPVANDLLSTPPEQLQVASVQTLPVSEEIEVTEELLVAEAFEQG